MTRGHILIAALAISTLALSIGIWLTHWRLTQPSNPVTAMLRCQTGERCVFPVSALGGGSVFDFGLAAQIALAKGLQVEIYGRACASACTIFVDRYLAAGGAICGSPGIEMWLHQGRVGSGEEIERYAEISGEYQVFRPRILAAGGLQREQWLVIKDALPACA